MECRLSPWTIGGYKAEQGHRDSIMLKAHVEEGPIVGFIVGRAPMAGAGEILNIGTALKFQRQGIGSMLIEHFCAICNERSVSAIWLEVRVTNQTAIDFYKSHQFIKKGVRPDFYSNPTEDADIMALVLR